MKTQICLYIEGEIKALAQSQGLNLSKSFEEYMLIQTSKDYKGENKDQIIQNLKKQLISLASELKDKNEELKKLKEKAKPKLLPFPAK